VVTITLLNGRDRAVEWLAGRGSVHDLRVEGERIVFGFTGTDDGQADLIEGLIASGVRMRSFEEKRSSFEDILVGVAESNRQP
jgi:hypothetical protein